MNLIKNEAHIWTTSLICSPDELASGQKLLNDDETARAARFHFPIHRQRFIAAHVWLRRVLSLYLNTQPDLIKFHYSDHEKPYIHHDLSSRIQFNLSHSADIAVCAVTLQNEIGVDIEKIEATDKTDLAKRFFSPEEFNEMISSDKAHRINLFYRLWTRKEAILKATGKGLSIPLNQFTVQATPDEQTIKLEDKKWLVFNLNIHPDYQAACAINSPVEQIIYLELANQQPKITKAVKY